MQLEVEQAIKYINYQNININLFYNLIYSNQWLLLFFKFYFVKKKKEDKRKEIYSKINKKIYIYI